MAFFGTEDIDFARTNLKRVNKGLFESNSNTDFRKMKAQIHMANKRIDANKLSAIDLKSFLRYRCIINDLSNNPLTRTNFTIQLYSQPPNPNPNFCRNLVRF